MLIRNNIYAKLSLLLSFAFLVGCSAKAFKLSDDEILAKKQKLERLLKSLSQSVNSQEASLLADVSINYSMVLAKEYQTVSNPVVQNVLVNSGIKERGLCIHWTEDLLRKLSSLNLESFSFHWGVAHRESSFKLEHSAVIVSAKDGNFTEGIVLDPWRCTGDLYFNLVVNDKYPWTKQYNKITEEILLELNN